MGAKQTKIDGCYLTDTPVLSGNVRRTLKTPFDSPTAFIYSTPPKDETTAERDAGNNQGIVQQEFDPRSPTFGIDRTPILFQDSFEYKTFQLDDTHADLLLESQSSMKDVPTPATNDSSVEMTLPECVEENKHVFRQQEFDPRSPSLVIERTPIIFNDNLKCKTFELNDSLADLLLKSQPSMKDGGTPVADDTSVEMTSPDCEEGSMHGTLQQEIDPRSPSLGIERTPIIFSDEDDETTHNEMLENTLKTLTLATSSSASNNAGKALFITKPKNKHLERVRTLKKFTAGVRTQRPSIYLDNSDIVENGSPLNKLNTLNPTPKQKSSTESGVKRTPLSCAKNRSYMRLRSVDYSPKLWSVRVASNDDNLNSLENVRILTGSPRTLKL